MHPMVPVLLPFLSGIIFSYRYAPSFELSLFLLCLSFIIPVHNLIKKTPFNPLNIAPVFFFIGAIFITPYISPKLPANHIRNFVEKPDNKYSKTVQDETGRMGEIVEGAVLYPPEYTEERTKLQVEAKKIVRGGEWLETTGKVFLTVQGRVEGITQGDHVKFMAHLREPWRYGNPGEFDYKEWLNMRGIYATGFVKNEKLIVKVKDAPPGAMKEINSMRARIGAFIGSSAIKNKEPLKALIISEMGGIDPEVKEAFIKTGTWHILSISGLHIGIIVLFSYQVFLFLLKRSERIALALNIKKVAMAASVLPVIFYGLLAGMPVPTQRSVVMVIAFVVTYLLNRGKDFFNTLALAAIIILLIYPYSVWDVSFQLTFVSLASIVYLEPRLKSFLSSKKEDPLKKDLAIKRFWEWKMLPALLATAAAIIGTSPVLAYHFHRLTLTGAIANTIAVPLTGAITPLLLVSAATLPISDSLAGLFLYFTDQLFSVLLLDVKFFAAFPYSSIWTATPTLLEIALVYLLMIFAANIKRWRHSVYAVAVLVFILIIDIGYWKYFSHSPELKVTFISIGQGDSEFVEFPDGETMLIDGGGKFRSDFDTGEKVIAPYLWGKKIKKIDYLVLSHAQLDHMGGLGFIAENFDVKEFWWNGEGELYRLGGILKAKGIKERVIEHPQKFEIGKVEIEILHPEKGLGLDANNMSLVLRIRNGENSFLFTGDLAAEGEAALLKKGDLKATVLKAAHHGSRYSSTMDFLEGTSPSIVVISAGLWNPFGFPHAETLERYSAIGAKVYRTDVNGAVTIISDGKSLKVEPYLTRKDL